jgi:hypothetical protein
VIAVPDEVIVETALRLPVVGTDSNEVKSHDAESFSVAFSCEPAALRDVVGCSKGCDHTFESECEVPMDSACPTVVEVELEA